MPQTGRERDRAGLALQTALSKLTNWLRVGAAVVVSIKSEGSVECDEVKVLRALVAIAALRHIAAIMEHLLRERLAHVNVPGGDLGGESLPQFKILRCPWRLEVQAL